MPFCTSCGEEIEAESAFCRGCGSPIKKQIQATANVNIRENVDTNSEDDSKSVFLDDEVQTQILEIVKKASEMVTFVSPYIDLWGHLKNEMDNAVNRGVMIRFVVRADDKKQPGQLKWIREHNEAKQLDQLKWFREHKIKVDQVERLHAKIYLNERTVLVSSMNITDTSTTNSRDFAMKVQSEADAKKFRSYVAYLTKDQAPQNTNPMNQQTEQTGFCIRDGTKIAFNTSRPLCDKCYPKWVKFKNKNYEEKHCHSCGKPNETTFARPLCLECFKKLN